LYSILLVGSLTRKTVADMTYNVFGGMLNFTQSVNQSLYCVTSYCGICFTGALIS